MSDQDLLDFMAMIKTCNTGRDDHYASTFLFYFPNLNEDESAILNSGHHCHHDGVSVMQVYQLVSDEPNIKEYPFFKKPNPSIFTWILVYILSPYLWFQIVRYFLKEKDDKNCIKQERFYSAGEQRAMAAKEISMSKSKAMAKKMGYTFNDFMMGLVSKSLKEYFVAHGDDSE